ncbi:MAG: hypothetical protein D6730_16860 [Bacteroidetes bacterium]|nr:MAG: hypothetical protein D6730_16860 [Bacteroidota bacterium]
MCSLLIHSYSAPMTLSKTSGKTPIALHQDPTSDTPASRAKGMYVMTEPGCIKSYSGAFLHITNGIRELSRYYHIDILAPKAVQPYIQNGNFTLIPSPEKRTVVDMNTGPNTNKLYGLLKDLKTLLVNHLPFFRYYRQVKAARPDFIYERISYLNFNAFLIAKLLNIPYITEVNGVYYEEIRHYYHSWLNGLARRLMLATYRRSDICYMVGGLKQSHGLDGGHYISVQNGIETQFIDRLKDHKKQLELPLQLCFVGHLAYHHRIEVLLDALRKLKQPQHIHIHFIGANFESLHQAIPPQIQHTFHGMVKHEQLLDLLQQFHVGLIPACRPGDSFMKLYTYGAAKLMCIVPRQRNVEQTFDKGELRFFELENSGQLAACIDEVVQQPEMIHTYGQRLYQTVRQRFTWTSIFEQVHTEIQRLLHARQGR